MDMFSRKRLRPNEWESMKPSKVVHIRELPEHTLEIDIARVLEKFGTIRDIAMIPKMGQALVEFDDINSAGHVVQMFQFETLYVSNKPARVNFSTSDHVVKRLPGPNDANKVLIFFIYEAVYPITVEVISKICAPHARIVRLFINRKAAVLQALVEFYSMEDAISVKRSLNGADIYSGCCTLKIEFATTNRVNVTTNSEDSWDYENVINDNNNYSLLPTQSLLGTPNSRMSHRLGTNPPKRTYDMFQQQHEIYGDEHSQDTMYPYDNTVEYNPPYTEYDDMNDQNGMAQPAVAMVYGLNMERLNCDKLFNLFCIYGNVMKVKFLKTKEGSAMVEMSDEQSVNRVIEHLQNHTLFGLVLKLQVSKQMHVTNVRNPFTLVDGTFSYKDFSNCNENRFVTPQKIAKNRICPPSQTVNYWNAPPHFGLENFTEEFNKVGAVLPSQFHQLSDREKSSSGLLQWETIEDATNSIALCNHILITIGSKYPYQLKVSFSEGPIRYNTTRPDITESNNNFPRGGGIRSRGRGRGSS